MCLVAWGPGAAARARTAPRNPLPPPPLPPGPWRARPLRALCRWRPCAAPPAAWPRAGRAPRPAARPPPPRSARAGARHVRVRVGRRKAAVARPALPAYMSCILAACLSVWLASAAASRSLGSLNAHLLGPGVGTLAVQQCVQAGRMGRLSRARHAGRRARGRPRAGRRRVNLAGLCGPVTASVRGCDSASPM